MDKSLQYAQVTTNFNSAYNSSLKLIPQSTTYIPISSSTNFCTFTNRSSSPLFRRSMSPPPRRPISTGSGPKFNFDLYRMDENNDKYDGYCSPSYRSISPPLSPSRIIHHYPIHSPVSSPPSTSQTLSKLRQINDELCQTLARSELIDQPSSSSPPHYHIHHYPLSQHSYRKHPSRSSSEERSSSVELKVSPKIHKARVTYKIHIPPRHRQERQHQKSSRHKPSSSDVYSSDDPMIVDLYPTRDQGFVKQIRKQSNNQNPWLVDGTSIRRNSYSDTSISRPPKTPKGPYYGDKPIKSHRRSNRDKEHRSSSSRHQSPYVTSRSKSASSKRPTWNPSTKTIPTDRSPKYFEPNLKSEYDRSNGEHIFDGTESEPIPQRKLISNRTTIRTGDPKFKKRIATAESKVKTAWEPTVTSLTESPVKESELPISVKKTTSDTPSKSKVQSNPSEPTTSTKKVIPTPRTTTNTGRSSLDDVPSKPRFESTPRNESDGHGNDQSVEDLFENESHTSEPSKKQELPRPPPPTEKTSVSTPQQPRKPPTELPKTTIPAPDKGTKSTIKDGVLISGDNTKNIRNQNPMPPPVTNVNNNNNDDDEASDAHNAQPTPSKIPTNQRKTPPPKPNNKDNEPVVDDDDADENDQEVARSFDINKWLSDASKAILGPSEKGNTVVPSIPPKPQPPPKAKSPPRRKEQPPSPIPDENLYKPPFGPKRIDKKAASSPPPPPSVPPPAPTTTTTTTGETDEAEDFFS